MSQALHFTAKSVLGHGPLESTCLPCCEASGSVICVSPYLSRHQNKNFLKLKDSRCTMRNASLVCGASSGSQRRNSDFSRQNKHGFSRKKNWRNEDRDGFDSLEESEMFSSKNGPLLTSSGNPRFQATAAPGPREKEIVELFRKVQAKLRERAAVKDEKKIEESQKKSKESETVDSLLKLLRKHSVQQGKGSRDVNRSSSDFILDHPVQNDLISEERSTAIYDSNSNVKHEKQESEATVINRPRSNFQRRSPVPQVKVQPVLSKEDNVHSVSRVNSDYKRKEKNLEPEFDVERDNESDADPPFSDDDVFDEIAAEFQNLIKKYEKTGEDGESDLSAQIRRLSEEMRRLAHNRSITVLNGNSEQNGLQSLVLPAAALGALGYGYMWWKGISFSDLMYVTKRSMATAVENLTKQLEHVSDALTAAKRHLTQRIENLDGKLDQQVDISKEIRVDVTKARDDLSKIDYDLGTMQFTLEGLNGQLLELGRKQDFANCGIEYLCSLATGKRISMQERLRKHLEAYGHSAPGLMGLKDLGLLDFGNGNGRRLIADDVSCDGMEKGSELKPKSLTRWSTVI